MAKDRLQLVSPPAPPTITAEDLEGATLAYARIDRAKFDCGQVAVSTIAVDPERFNHTRTLRLAAPVRILILRTP